MQCRRTLSPSIEEWFPTWRRSRTSSPSSPLHPRRMRSQEDFTESNLCDSGWVAESVLQRPIELQSFMRLGGIQPQPSRILEEFPTACPQLQAEVIDGVVSVRICRKHEPKK